ncbi:tryptophan-rich sensory protein [Candidatus Saccharibacteria bacterium]|nr:tryptophan-rich sensory protein [Candidatus Saccharibacteria bacterium]
MNTSSWYKALNKPSWAPQEWVFGTIWSFLYLIIFIVNIYIGLLFLQNKISFNVALPFWLNLFFNLIYSPLQFGLRNNTLALLDISLVLITIIWAMIMIWPVSKIVTIAFAPYLIWVTIATILQTYITLNN